MDDRLQPARRSGVLLGDWTGGRRDSLMDGFDWGYCWHRSLVLAGCKAALSWYRRVKKILEISKLLTELKRSLWKLGLERLWG
jgi:hypothetical protein